MTQHVIALAHAKVNWGLEVLARRPDGFHEIRTLAHTISLHDRLEVAVVEAGIRLAVRGPWPVPGGRDNICVRAAEAFCEAFGAPDGASIVLDKRIPPGSGLGGGSSDAVAVLLALCRLTGIRTQEALEGIAAGLGSDTVLFLFGGATLCEGRGEIVTRVDCPRQHDLVIARPACSVATREAYALLGPEDFSGGRRVEALAGALVAGAEVAELARHLHNAFRGKVVAHHPQIGRLREEVLRAGARGSEMTGSGSAVFGIADGAYHAREMAGRLAALGYWARAARTVDYGCLLEEEGPDD